MPIRYSSVVGGSSGTGFNLDVGSSGNTTFYFDTPQPAGGYSITSQLADSSIEFYAIAEDGTLAGYTNTKALSATKDFDTLVVYGATTNDLITFEYKSTTLPTASGDQDSGAAPFITSVSDADLANIDDTTIIAGGNFATNVVVTFTGTDAVVRNAKSVVRTNSTQLIVTRPDDFLEDNSPYTLTVSNPGITQSAIITNTSPITAGGNPVWVTAAGALAATVLQAYSVTVEATDPDGGTITYSVVTGSLPAGLSLNSSTGEISGTPTSIQTEEFTIAATDSGGNITNRSFSIPGFNLTNALFYEFEDNLVDSNSVGPTLSVARGTVSYNTNGLFGGKVYTPDGNSTLRAYHTLATGNSARTLSAWVFFDSSNGSNRGLIIGTGGHGTNQGSFDLEYNGYDGSSVSVGWITLHTWNGGVRIHNQIITDQWHHVALVHDGGDVSAANTRLYINGVQVATAQNTITINTTGTHQLLFGGRVWDALQDIRWSGGLDQVLLFPRALSSAEVSLLHSGNGLRG